MIDTHTHLYLPEFDTDGGGRAAVARAMAVGVEKMIFPNVDLTSVEPMEALAAEFPGQVYVAMGLHPTEVKESAADDLALIMQRLEAGAGRYVAVGEVGIDLYWDATYREQQMQVFERQVEAARALGLPVIIHCREGLDETLEVLRGAGPVDAVFHSFGGTVADVDRIRRVGDFYFGINGIVTFKNSKLREVLPSIGKDRLLLETDSPYLAPVPKRGKRNESAFLPHVAAHVGDALQLTTTQIDEITTKNALNLFKRLNFK